MMKYLIYISTIFYLGSCNSQNIVTNKKCNENGYFKSQFFYNINNVEAYTFKLKNSEDKNVTLSMFKTSLEKISEYVKVNYTLLANYEFGYTSSEIYNKEKDRWLAWYEKNKCNNLQWKNGADH